MFQKVFHKVSKPSRANLQQGKQVDVFKRRASVHRSRMSESLSSDITGGVDLDFHPRQG